MNNKLIIKLVFILLSMCFYILICAAEKIRYLSVEHPHITYINPKFFSFINQSARRYGRQDPVHYYEMHMHSLFYMDNKFMLDFYFYEWLTNVYKPTFVEMHFKWCDLVHKDKFFGTALNQGNLTKPCPHPPGIYRLYNMTVPPASIPPSFPFTKGRIYCNLTWAKTRKDPKEWLGDGYIDMEIKYWNRKTKTKA